MEKRGEKGPLTRKLGFVSPLAEKKERTWKRVRDDFFREIFETCVGRKRKMMRKRLEEGFFSSLHQKVLVVGGGDELRVF